MLSTWLVLRMRSPLALLSANDVRHPQMLPVLGLGNLSLVGNRNNSEFSPILNTCISTTSESHNSLLVEMQKERCISLG